MAIALEQRKVLVLNRHWVAVGFRPVRRAISLLFSAYRDGTPKARVMRPVRVEGVCDGRVVETTQFECYDWADWAALRPREGDDVIRVRRGDTILLPSTIILTRYDRFPGYRAEFSRRTLYKRDQNRCQYCGDQPGTGELTIDHVVPRCQGGGTSWENCVLACTQCNSQKAGRRPEQAQKEILPKARQKLWRGPSPMRLLRLPARPRPGLLRDAPAVVCKDWVAFVSEAYWSVELQNDMGE